MDAFGIFPIYPITSTNNPAKAVLTHFGEWSNTLTFTIKDPSWTYLLFYLGVDTQYNHTHVIPFILTPSSSAINMGDIDYWALSGTVSNEIVRIALSAARVTPAPTKFTFTGNSISFRQSSIWLF